MIIDLDEKGIAIKTIFDGYDFLQHELGKMLIPDGVVGKVLSSTFITDMYSNVNEFLQYCDNNLDKYSLEHYIVTPLMHKYKVGIYSLMDCFDINNPLRNKNYVLFNSYIIEPLLKVYPFLKDTLFWVCPTFNENGECEAIGFRVVDKQTVLNSFKWLFTCGNNIIYGKNTVNKNKTCYVVEGFRDYVALHELGYNVIGLGSVVISKHQQRYIDGLNDVILLLDNDNFGLQKTIQYKDKYRIATLTNTEEKDAYDTWLRYNKINIAEIK